MDMLPCPAPGLRLNIPEAQYRAWDAANQSFLCDLLRYPPGIAKALRDAPDDPTDAMEVGRAAHMLLLEPHRFANTYGVLPPNTDLRTKAGKAVQSEMLASGLTPLKPADWEMVNGWNISVQHNRLLRSALDKVHEHQSAECSIVWKDGGTGVLCKGRLDGWVGGTILDLKTSAAIDTHALQSAVVRYGIDVQAAFYLDGAEQAMECPEGVQFLLVYLLKMPGWPVRVVDLSDWIERGRAMYRKALRIYSQCRESGEWPGYEAAGIESLPMPAWAERDY